jgi:hypothetical protein
MFPRRHNPGSLARASVDKDGDDPENGIHGCKMLALTGIRICGKDGGRRP